MNTTVVGILADQQVATAPKIEILATCASQIALAAN
jgi:hypothetical protein